jgi:hypothetical protein
LTLSSYIQNHLIASLLSFLLCVVVGEFVVRLTHHLLLWSHCSDWRTSCLLDSVAVVGCVYPSVSSVLSTRTTLFLRHWIGLVLLPAFADELLGMFQPATELLGMIQTVERVSRVMCPIVPLRFL